MPRTTSGTRRLFRWIGNGLLLVMLVWTLVPFYWMIATSLKADREIYGFEATLVPHHPTLAAYVRLFQQTPFLKYVRNSTIIAVSTTAVSLVFGCLGAYALARLRFRGRRLIARGLVFTYLVPPSLLFIPLFAMMSALSLVDTHQGLILAYLGFTVPFCLPMSLPALAVVAFFSFTQAWNEFLYANVFVNSVEVRTITTGLTLFIVEDVFFWGPMMGAAFLSALPPLVVYLVFQRWVVKGLTLGAVKG